MIQTQCEDVFSPFYHRSGLTWLEDWHQFFRFYDLFPDCHQDIAEQFNCLSRIIIVLILILYLFYGFNRYVFILMTIIFVMIILYVFLNKPSMKENYQRPDVILYDSKNPQQTITIPSWNSNPQLIDAQQASTWCKPDQPLDETTASINQALAGGANPKTRAIPVIPPPIYDAQTWVPNDFVVPFRINDQRRQELSQNGYMTWDRDISARVARDLDSTYACVPTDTGKTPVREDFHQSSSTRTPIKDVIREDYPYDNATYRLPTTVGESMDTAFGYYPENSRYNYPVNSPPVRCMYSPEQMEYNKNLFSIPLQPNVYTRSQVNQPDASMSNLGISFTQPHLPYACRMDDRGNMMIDEYDPNQYPSEYLLRGRDRFANDIQRNEIYDPRLTGYGTSYRSYLDPTTGQSRFYYNDVDAHTQYNFISRNKLDFTNFAPNSGPYPGLPPDDFRSLADQTFHNDSMKQRTELQYRLMAKNSHREWQQRAAPIQTQGFGPAGMGMAGSSSYGGPRGG